MEELIPNDYGEKYRLYVSLKKEIEDLEARFKEELAAKFEESNEKAIIKDGVKFTYVKPTVRHTFDSKKLQEEEPETYDKYIKETQVKGSIRMSIEPI